MIIIILLSCDKGLYVLHYVSIMFLSSISSTTMISLSLYLSSSVSKCIALISTYTVTMIQYYIDFCFGFIINKDV